MPTGKITKEYNCPYCGGRFKDDKWVYDHIIPRNIGGPKQFKLISCASCNYRIGREIEQPALRVSAILDLYCEQVYDGFKISTRRRKRGLAPMYKNYGVSCGRKVRFMRDLESGERHLVFLDGTPKTIPEHGVAWTPANTYEDDEPFLRLVNKIVLGTMFWLWGDVVRESRGIRNLQTRLWKEAERSGTIELHEDESHLSFVDEDPPFGRIAQDALDNKPDHTICIFRQDEFIFGLVNLFGELESMDFIVDQELAGNLDNGDAEVMILKTTENSVTRMDLDEYIEYKSKSLGKRLSMRCEVPFDRED